MSNSFFGFFFSDLNANSLSPLSLNMIEVSQSISPCPKLDYLWLFYPSGSPLDQDQFLNVISSSFIDTRTCAACLEMSLALLLQLLASQVWGCKVKMFTMIEQQIQESVRHMSVVMSFHGPVFSRFLVFLRDPEHNQQLTYNGCACPTAWSQTWISKDGTWEATEAEKQFVIVVSCSPSMPTPCLIASEHLSTVIDKVFFNMQW